MYILILHEMTNCIYKIFFFSRLINVKTIDVINTFFFLSEFIMLDIPDKNLDFSI